MENPKIDPEWHRGMIGQLNQALIFLITFSLLIVAAVFIWLEWGDPIAGWWEQPAVAERAAAPAPAKAATAADEAVVDGVHVASGLVVAEGFETVKATCTACHSGKLVTQNRATREGWAEMIDWMQETQGLWELGDQEEVILDYLATHYAPEEIGRRAALDVEAIEWYLLEEAE